MTVTETSVPGLLVIETKIYRDGRGHFLETWNINRYREIGIPDRFVQDNVSVSRRGVLRGLHYQMPFGQGKLVSVLYGEVLDVAVDIRLGSPTFGEVFKAVLSSDNGRQLYIPDGLAHGFQVLSDVAVFAYKCTEYYHPEAEHTIVWNDPVIGIDWPIDDPIVSEKDSRGLRLEEISRAHLPSFA